MPQINLKRTFTLSSMALLIMALIVSCSKDKGNSSSSSTITDKVVADPSFSLLEKAVVKAGLGTTLSGNGPFTVFAPNDAAFTASGISSSSIDGLSTDYLKKLLLYHTLASKVLAADVPAGPNAKITTANSPADSLFITKNAAGVFVNGIKVVTPDVTASNGVIHVLQKVLLPPAGNIVATAQANLGGDNGLDSLVVAIVRADAASPGLINLLNGNVITVFAPTNKAFRDLLTALSLNNIGQIPIATLQAVLSYHVVSGRAFSSDLSNGTILMLAGGTTTVNLTNGTGGGPTITGNGNAGAKSNIIATNIMATNGVVHVIDKVLLP